MQEDQRTHPVRSGAAGGPPRALWWSIPALALSLLAVRLAGLDRSYDGRILLLLGFALLTTLPLVAAAVTGSVYLERPRPALLLRACSALPWRSRSSRPRSSRRWGSIPRSGSTGGSSSRRPPALSSVRGSRSGRGATRTGPAPTSRGGSSPSSRSPSSPASTRPPRGCPCSSPPPRASRPCATRCSAPPWRGSRWRPPSSHGTPSPPPLPLSAGTHSPWPWLRPGSSGSWSRRSSEASSGP